MIEDTPLLADTIFALERAVAAQPQLSAGHLHLGEAYRRAGRLADAVESLRQGLYLDPNSVEGHNALGAALLAMRDFPDAAENFSRAVALAPNTVDSLGNLSMALRRAGRLEEAVDASRRAFALAPQNAGIVLTHARALRAGGKLDEAIDVLTGAIDNDTHNPEMLFALGDALESARRYTDAADAFAATIRLMPTWSNPRFALGAALARAGRLSEALTAYREASIALPRDAALHSNVVFGTLYDPNATDESLAAVNHYWWYRHAEKYLRLVGAHKNDRKPSRVLRIGYISPNFREHPISFFFEPILASHDRANAECFLYSDNECVDDTTRRLQSIAQSRGHQWKQITELNDANLAMQIRADEIDILIDLTQHMPGNRMCVFARKAAPVQISYLAYPYATGVETIDYHLSDPVLDPPERGGEKLLRLPQTYFCYQPPIDAKSIEIIPEAPSRKNGVVTFGSMNGMLKINSPTLDAWASVMKAINLSRIIVKAQGLEDPRARERLIGEFERRGIASDRVELLGFSPLSSAMKEMSDRVDIVLDAMPYCGGMTTCHLLWMGLPVVTIAGALPIHRMGASILNTIGMPELVAGGVEDYGKIAATLSRDVDYREHLRHTLREKMQHSPLMDAATFTRSLEALYRQAWRDWCAASK